MTMPSPFSPFEPDEFDRITAHLPVLTAFQAAWEEAADLLHETRPGGFDVEEIGHIAFDALPGHEKDAALGELFYTFWSATRADRDTRARYATERGEQS
ncbi:hypothetical protein [Streptomyces reniochalinae]|uniref:Uncharacterized protein n=1 Tax=Streptomyces reniochalinae TaxID=2250578 RepID=A0A367EWQ1_9ACTN|nr:hypothetical protein [Streptomyces reniochalinae]RCG21807.1 hypothetical protein DQ392_08855 [Streptomyces reniochalinae]